MSLCWPDHFCSLLLLLLSLLVCCDAGTFLDSFALIQLTPPAANQVASLQVGDDVDVEVIEGVPASVLRGTITGPGSVESTFNVTIPDLPPERRFMTNVAPESMKLKARRATADPGVADVAAAATVAQAKSPEGLAAGLDVFAALDSNGDGAVTRAEVDQALVKLLSKARPEGIQPTALPQVISTPSPAPAELPSGQECWVNGYTHDACCDMYWGAKGDENCWNGFYTFEHCCLPDEQVMEESLRYSDGQQQEGNAKLSQLKTAEEERAKERRDAEQAAQLAAQQKREAAKEEDAALERRRKEEEVRAAREFELRMAEREERLMQQAKSSPNKQKSGKTQTEACPDGFQLLEGDLPGNDQFGRDDKLKRKTIDLCGKECAKNPKCKSFEWSPSTSRCNTNKVAEPKAPAHLDFVFCSRTRFD